METETTTPTVTQAVAALYVPPTEEKKAFLKALAKAQGEFEPVVKNKLANIRPRDASKTPYQFTYAELGEILRATRPALSKYGLSLRGSTLPRDGNCWIQSILAHEDGYEDISEVILNMDEGADIKTIGIRMSYWRRYMQVNQVNVAGMDDSDEDGSEAGDGDSERGGNNDQRASTQTRTRPEPAAEGAGTGRTKKAAAAPAKAPAEPPAQPPAEPPPPAAPAPAPAKAPAPPPPAPPAPAPAPAPAAQAGEVVEMAAPGQITWVINKLEFECNMSTEQRDAWLSEKGVADVHAMTKQAFIDVRPLVMRKVAEA